VRRNHIAWSWIALMLAMLGTGAAQADGKGQVDDLLQRSRTLMAGQAPVFQPGSWASYRLSIRDQEQSGSAASMEAILKISFPVHVDPEHPLPEGAFWMEFEFADPAPTGEGITFLALKMLVQGDPRDPGSVKRAFITAGSRRPFELGDKWLKREPAEAEQACQRGDAQGCAKAGGKVRQFEPKKVYTKAGWLEARRVLIELPDGSSQQMWHSAKVPVLGLVRANLAHMMDLELEGFGSGALSRIDETQASMLPDPEELTKELQALEGS
jgi:hypothetical protein